MTTPEVQNPIILFDGVCNLCTGSVRFIINRDPRAIFKFAPLQSEIGKKLLSRYDNDLQDLDTIILIEHGKLYFKSTAALRITKKLGYLWQLLYIFVLVPGPIRDYIYDIVAKNRYNWYGKKSDCMVPTPDIKNRFLE